MPQWGRRGDVSSHIVHRWCETVKSLIVFVQKPVDMKKLGNNCHGKIIKCQKVIQKSMAQENYYAGKYKFEK